MPALSILIWLPAACGLLGSLAPVRAAAAGEEEPERARGWSLPGLVALVGTLGALGLAIGYIADYKPGAGLQHLTDVMWISALGIHYKLAVTGLNVFLVGMTTLLFAAAILACNVRRSAPIERPRLFYFQFMLAESAVLGAFLAQDLALFVAFFDLMLIPFYFLIGGWGREPGRVKATIKLVIYTLVGSLLMLAAAIATGVLAAQQGGGHIDFALSQPALITVQGRELANVPESARRRIRRLQRLYVEEWVTVLLELFASTPQARLRAAVHAVFGLLNSTPHSADEMEPAAMAEMLYTMADAALVASAAPPR